MYQSGGASLGKYPRWALDMVVRRTPRSGVEPVDGVFRIVGSFFVQENQLFLRSNGDRFQALFDAAHRGLGIGQSYDENAIGLADAALRPRSQAAVALVEHNAVLVFLLAQPGRQAEFIGRFHDSGAQSSSDRVRC